MANDDSDFLMISGLKHFQFCRRRWALVVTVQPTAKLQQMMHRNGKKRRFAPLNSVFSQKAAKTPRGIHHG